MALAPGTRVGTYEVIASLGPVEFDQSQGSVSPGGRWLAYVSNESGVNEVFVRPFTSDSRSGAATRGAAALISRGGGLSPRWRGNGEELFYQSSAGSVMAVRVSRDRFDKSTELFRAPGMLADWGVTPDGQRFLVALPVKQGAPVPFNVVVNWQAPLER